jgi:hypothetical protein
MLLLLRLLRACAPCCEGSRSRSRMLLVCTVTPCLLRASTPCCEGRSSLFLLLLLLLLLL